MSEPYTAHGLGGIFKMGQSDDLSLIPGTHGGRRELSCPLTSAHEHVCAPIIDKPHTNMLPHQRRARALTVSASTNSVGHSEQEVSIWEELTNLDPIPRRLSPR